MTTLHADKDHVSDSDSPWREFSRRTAAESGRTSVEDLPAPEVEDVPGAVPLLQRRWELRGRDVQVDSDQRDANQAHMNPPLSHVELSGGGVSFLPLTDGVTATTTHRATCQVTLRSRQVSHHVVTVRRRVRNLTASCTSQHVELICVCAEFSRRKQKTPVDDWYHCRS